MQTLTYGLLLPQSGDKGSTLFSALAADISHMDAHTHDGVNSPLISVFAIKAVTQTLPATNWVSYGGPVGDYRQLVAMPTGFSFDEHTMSFRSNGEYCYLKVVKINPTSYYVYSNDPTITLVVNYGG